MRNKVIYTNTDSLDLTKAAGMKLLTAPDAVQFEEYWCKIVNEAELTNCDSFVFLTILEQGV